MPGFGGAVPSWADMNSAGELPRRLALLDPPANLFCRPRPAIVRTLLISAGVPVYFIWRREG
jgi:hypothetical protein